MKKHIFEKLKNANPLYFLLAVIALIVGVPLVVFLIAYVKLESASLVEDFTNIVKVIAIIGTGVLAITVSFFVVLPIVLFVIKRISCYFSLWLICRKHGKKFKITRFPFASLFGINKREDILISFSDEIYCVHFIDMLFRSRRGFILINENEYCIAKMRPDMGGIGGGFIKGQYNYPNISAVSSSPKSYKTYSFPNFDDSRGKHIIVVHPTPNHALTVDRSMPENGMKPIHSGYGVGKIHYFSLVGLKALIKRK